MVLSVHISLLLVMLLRGLGLPWNSRKKEKNKTSMSIDVLLDQFPGNTMLGLWLTVMHICFWIYELMLRNVRRTTSNWLSHIGYVQHLLPSGIKEMLTADWTNTK